MSFACFHRFKLSPVLDSISTSCATRCLAAIGAATVLCSTVRALRFLHSLYFCDVDIKKKYEAAGDWALVTGGSEGIGFAMAMELARRGMNVAIIALHEDLLYNAAKAIQEAYPTVSVVAIPFNFLTTDESSFDFLFEQLSVYRFSVLVNNVGGFYRYPKPLDAAALSEDLRLLRLNCETQIRMTKYLLPHFKAHRCGAIINLASMAALLPSPYLTTYAGTKAFNLAFARSLAAEVAEFGIDVLIVTPAFVSTRITQGVEDRPFQPGEHGTVDPTEMARQTLRKLGTVQQTCGHNRHDWVLALYPLVAKFAGPIFLNIVKDKFITSQDKERSEKKKTVDE